MFLLIDLKKAFVTVDNRRIATQLSVGLLSSSVASLNRKAPNTFSYCVTVVTLSRCKIAHVLAGA